MIALRETASVKDYWDLLKPRVMSLVIFTAFCGMWMAPGAIDPVKGLIAILCIAIGAGAAGCLNMWYERDLDRKMERTRKRPTATGAISADAALIFGSTLSAASVLLMQMCINAIAAGLLAITILFYVFIYTILLKPSTPHNIVLGGAAGAFPPVIGWACVDSPNILPFVMFLIIFVWTPAHFWALAINNMNDYARANLPMMPNVIGIERTKKQIVWYAFLTVASTLLPYFLNMSGIFYLSISIFFGIGFLYLSIQLMINKESKDGTKLFAYSILYLFLVFASLIFDKR